MTIPEQKKASGQLCTPSSMAFSRPLIPGFVSVCVNWEGCERRACASIGGAGPEAYTDILTGDEGQVILR